MKIELTIRIPNDSYSHTCAGLNLFITRLAPHEMICQEDADCNYPVVTANVRVRFFTNFLGNVLNKEDNTAILAPTHLCTFHP